MSRLVTVMVAVAVAAALLASVVSAKRREKTLFHEGEGYNVYAHKPDDVLDYEEFYEGERHADTHERHGRGKQQYPNGESYEGYIYMLWFHLQPTWYATSDAAF